MVHVILVSALGSNTSYFLFWGTFITWDRGLDSDLDQGLTISCKSSQGRPWPYQLEVHIVFGYFGSRSNDTKSGVFCWLKHTKWTSSSNIIVWWLLIIRLNLQIGFKKDLPTRFWKFLHVWNQLRFLFLIVSLLLDKLLWFKISPLNQYVILGVGTMIQN